LEGCMPLAQEACPGSKAPHRPHPRWACPHARFWHTSTLVAGGSHHQFGHVLGPGPALLMLPRLQVRAGSDGPVDGPGMHGILAVCLHVIHCLQVRMWGWHLCKLACTAYPCNLAPGWTVRLGRLGCSRGPCLHVRLYCCLAEVRRHQRGLPIPLHFLFCRYTLSTPLSRRGLTIPTKAAPSLYG